MQHPENVEWRGATGGLLQACSGPPEEKEKIVNNGIARLKQQRGADAIKVLHPKDELSSGRTTCTASVELDFGNGNKFTYCNSGANRGSEKGCKKFRMVGGACPHGGRKRAAEAKMPDAVTRKRAGPQAAKRVHKGGAGSSSDEDEEYECEDCSDDGSEQETTPPPPAANGPAHADTQAGGSAFAATLAGFGASTESAQALAAAAAAAQQQQQQQSSFEWRRVQ